MNFFLIFAKKQMEQSNTSFSIKTMEHSFCLIQNFLLFPQIHRSMIKTKVHHDQNPAISKNGQFSAYFPSTNVIPKLGSFQATISNQNLSQETISTAQASQRNTKTPKIKLKDYLFQVQTSANKNAFEKRKILESLSEKRNKLQTQNEQNLFKSQAKQIRKSKYSITNSEMFEILKKQIEFQIRSNLEQINTFANQLRVQNKSTKVPTNRQMMTMYKLRSLLKQQMHGCIKQMKDTLYKEKIQRGQCVEIQIQLDQQLMGRDIGFTEEMFNKKYMELSEISKR